MDDVCIEANLSKGGLYRHVVSKDELFLQVAIENYAALMNDVRSSKVDDACSAYDELCGYIAVLLDFAGARSQGTQVIFQCEEIERILDRNAPSFGEYRRTRESAVTLALFVLNRGRSDGSIRSDFSTEQLVATLRGALQGLLRIDTSTTEFRQVVPPDAPPAECANLVMQLMRPPR